MIEPVKLQLVAAYIIIADHVILSPVVMSYIENQRSAGTLNKYICKNAWFAYVIFYYIG